MQDRDKQRSPGPWQHATLSLPDKPPLLEVKDERSFIVAGVKLSEAEARQLWRELAAELKLAAELRCDLVFDADYVRELERVADTARRYLTDGFGVAGENHRNLKAALKELDA